MERQLGYRDLLTQKDYLKVIIANVITRFGDSVDSIAFTWLMYAITGSAAWSAIIFGVNQLPTILLQPFTGVLVERWRKKRLMVMMDIVRGSLVIGFIALYMLELLNPWTMLLFTVSISTVEAFRDPAGMALVPKILDRELYEFGKGLGSALGMVMQMVGLALGGVIIGMFGIQVAILIDAVTYFLSAGVLSLIRYREEEITKVKLNVQEYGRNLKEGFAYVKTSRIIVNFCILVFALNGLLTPVNSFMAPLVDLLGQGSEFMSVMSLTIVIGMGVASFLYPYLRRKCKTSRIVCVSGVILGIAYLTFPLATFLKENAVIAGVMCILAGLAMGAACGMISAVMGAEFMKAVDHEHIARCGGVFNSVGSAATPIISGLCSILAVFCPVSVIFVACGSLSVILFIYMAIRRMQFEAPTPKEA